MKRCLVTFTQEELWYLHSVVRHGTTQSWIGSSPPYSRELNDQIAEALINGDDSEALSIGEDEAMCLDAVVDQHGKSSKGAIVGRDILLKVFRARFGYRDATEDVQEWLDSTLELCPEGHTYTEANTYASREGRFCKECYERNQDASTSTDNDASEDGQPEPVTVAGATHGSV